MWSELILCHHNRLLFMSDQRRLSPASRAVFLFSSPSAVPRLPITNTYWIQFYLSFLPPSIHTSLSSLHLGTKERTAVLCGSRGAPWAAQLYCLFPCCFDPGGVVWLMCLVHRQHPMINGGVNMMRELTRMFTLLYTAKPQHITASFCSHHCFVLDQHICLAPTAVNSRCYRNEATLSRCIFGVRLMIGVFRVSVVSQSRGHLSWRCNFCRLFWMSVWLVDWF
jgi:hypothetical protein